MRAPVAGGPSSHIDSAPVGEPAPALARWARHVAVTLGRPRLLVGLLVVYVPFFVAFFASSLGFSLPHAASACQGQPVLDQRWGYDATEVAAYLRECGVAGRAAVAAQQDADLVYPALFGAVVTVASALLLRALRLPRRHWAHALLLLPMISALADYLENAGIRALLATYPEQPAIVPAMSVVTTIKLATGWACMAVLVVLAAAAGLRRLKRGATAPAARLP